MRAEKQLLLDGIKEQIGSAKGLIVTSYEKLPPNISWDLRDQLAKSKSVFEVVRKRVFLKAVEQLGVNIDASLLSGHIGVVFVEQEDAAPSVKTVFKFAEENKGMTVVCGQVEGTIYNGPDMAMLAALPSMNEMRAQFLSLLESPMSHLLSVFESVMGDPLSVLEQKSESENK
jgi:large subunit ribosomal protein L10